MEKIEKLRKDIDDYDAKILEFLEKRKNIARDIGKLKRIENIEIIDPEREKKILSNKGEFKYIFKEIIGLCRKIENDLDVVYLGPEGTFTEEAALSFFSSYTKIIPVDSIEEVFNNVEKGKYGIVPVENSTHGSVPETVDLLIERSVYIAGEVIKKISHNLISNKPMNEIKKIYSHPQSFAQCKNFIAKHVPNAELIPVDSTAKGVIIAKENNEAAIGTILAAQKYKMKIMRKYIEDNPNNYTRFLVLFKNQGEGDMTSVLFSIKNDPGSLHNVLKAFSDEKINLTKIESRPSKRNPWEYIFYIDFEGNLKEKRVKKSLQKLQSSTMFFKTLGSYPSWEED